MVVLTPTNLKKERMLTELNEKTSKADQATSQLNVTLKLDPGNSQIFDSPKQEKTSQIIPEIHNENLDEDHIKEKNNANIENKSPKSPTSKNNRAKNNSLLKLDNSKGKKENLKGEFQVVRSMSD